MSSEVQGFGYCTPIASQLKQSTTSKHLFQQIATNIISSFSTLGMEKEN